MSTDAIEREEIETASGGGFGAMTPPPTRVVAPKQPPKPPTPAEIQALLPGLWMYNPSEQWVSTEVHGIMRWLPPDLGGAIEPHPVTGEPVRCDGMYEAKGRVLAQRDSSGKMIEGQDAYAVVSFMIHRERLGEMGVVYIPRRDAEEDAALKQIARDVYLKYRESVDDKVIDRRREFKARWERNPAKAGVKCPPPTPTELAAMDRAQEREQKATYRFECDVQDCPGYAANEWEKFARHMQAAHGIVPKRAKYEDGAGATSGAAVAAVSVDETDAEESGMAEARGELKKRARRKARS